jgi:hypothetical protein
MIIQRFISESQKDVWHDEYTSLKQRTQSIEEFSYKFRELKRKIDPTSATPVGDVVRDFLGKINPQIRILIGATKLTTLDAAVTAARSIEATLRAAQPQLFASNNAHLETLVQSVTQLAEEVKEIKTAPRDVVRPVLTKG